MEQSFQSFSPRKHPILLLAAAILIGGAIVYLAIFRQRSAAAEFFTQPVERGPVRNVVNATGTVQALLTVQVGSQVTGQVQALHADYNSVVKRGELLAKIDPRRFQAEVNEARANLQAAQARVHTTEADLNSQIANRQSAQANVDSARVARDNAAQILARYEKLRQDGILSQNDFDNAKASADSTAARYNQAVAQGEQVEAQTNATRAQVEQAKAQVEQAQAALNQSQVNLEFTDISSPVDGVVVSRNVDVGQTVAATLQAPTIFVIANDLTKMQVHASVDEADIGNISEAASVHFTVDAYPNRTFAGKIAEIRLEPQTVQSVVTYSVIINVENERLELKPGMTANITITVAEQNDVLKIPNTALRYLPPGVTREQVAKMVRQPGTALTSSAHETLPQATSDPPQAKKPTPEMLGKEPKSRAFGANRSQPAEAELAPGQLWNPAEKIQFPHRRAPSARPGIVWALGKQRKPEARQILLGITDGVATQVISGELKEGERVIVSDSSPAASPQTPPAGGPPGPGGGQRFIFGGGPRR